jgi:hypothetical protein
VRITRFSVLHWQLRLAAKYAGYNAKNAWKRSQFHDIHIAFDDEDYVPLLMK